MIFLHDDSEFEQLVAIVARESGISEALIEKLDAMERRTARLLTDSQRGA